VTGVFLPATSGSVCAAPLSVPRSRSAHRVCVHRACELARRDSGYLNSQTAPGVPAERKGTVTIENPTVVWLAHIVAAASQPCGTDFDAFLAASESAASELSQLIDRFLNAYMVNVLISTKGNHTIQEHLRALAIMIRDYAKEAVSRDCEQEDIDIMLFAKGLLEELLSQLSEAEDWTSETMIPVFADALHYADLQWYYQTSRGL
jgi:hypothetical protein